MIQTTGRRVVLEPILEYPSDVIQAPNRTSRWKNGAISICGRVVSLGRENSGLQVGDIVYHSDSCGKKIDDEKYNVIHEDDIMFTSEQPLPVQWVGAEERYDVA